MDVKDATRGRLEGLDLFRGLAVAGMIIVNTPGSGDHVWWPLDHAAWHGFTPTDLVFPAFLCAMGMALGLSFPRSIDRAAWLRIARRMALLIAIGWAIQLLARMTFSDFRFFGVLPRIALCYGLAAALAILTARRDEAGRRHLSGGALLIAALGALAAYAAMLLLVPVPGHGAGQLTPQGNLAGYVDRTLFTTRHIWRFGTDAAGNIAYDPEGLLSTLAALANVLFGMLAALLWRRDPRRATAWLAVAGLALILAGLALTPWLPLNKRIWTSSFALLTSGLSAWLLVVAILAADRSRLRPAMAPLRVLGMNAILGYVLSLLIGIAGMRLSVAGGSFQAWAFSALRELAPDPYLASFLYSAIVLALVIAALAPLHRRGLFLRL